MKHLKLTYILITVLILSLNACKVDSDIDDAANTIADALGSGIENNDEKIDDYEDAYSDTEREYLDGDEGLQILDNDVPTERYFMGTFYKASGYGQCAEFPSVTRLYSYDDFIYIENNQQDLLAVAELFQDDTFDFSFIVLNEFGEKLKNTCTCYYKEYEWYGDEWDCTCDGDNNCDLRYTGKNN